jgi:Extracellular link domain
MSDNNTNATSTQIFDTLFTKSNVILIVWFLAIYLVVYVLLNMFYNKGTGVENYTARMSKIIDILVFIFLFCYILIQSQTMSTADQENALSDFVNKIKIYIEDSYSLFALIFFIGCLYLTIYFLGIPMDSANKPYTISIIENISFILLAIIIINDGFKYIFGIDLINYLLSSSTIDWLKHKDTKKAEEKKDSSGNNVDDKKSDHGSEKGDHGKPDEVFNIRNNLYTYDEAAAVCSIYNAKLATYDQVEDAYNAGGEWCNYGWSEGQMALFPTQKGTWNKLQGSEKTKHACGRPGINGGYMSNGNLRFGVNCYGQKPVIKPADQSLMAANQEIKVPESDADKEMNIKLKIWEQDPDKFLLVNSFNKKEWSEY